MNDDSINFYISHLFFKWNDAAWQDGDNNNVEPAWLFKYSDAGPFTLSCNQANYLESAGGICYRTASNLDTFFVDPAFNLISGGLGMPNLSTFNTYVSFMAWESDDTGGTGTAGCHPGNHSNEISSQHCDNLTLAAMELGDDPNVWNNRIPSQSLPGRSEVGFAALWRYTHGYRFNDPLQFGPVSSTAKSHYNSNRSAPANTPGFYFGYNHENSWINNAQDSPDVWYTFEVTDGPKRVTISTDHPDTDFDTYLHLLSISPDGQFFAYIDFDDNIDGDGGNRKSLVEKDLCVGTYTIVVEGFNQKVGNFVLSVESTDLDNSEINPGTITAVETSFCVGDELPDIINVTFPSSSLSIQSNTDPVDRYEWQKKIGPGSMGWTTINGAEDATYVNPDVMVDDPVSYRRRALYCNIWTDWSNEVTMTNDGGTIDPGNVELRVNCDLDLSSRVWDIITIPTASVPGCFGSRRDTVGGVLITYFTSGEPEPIETRWEMSYDGGDWTIVSNGSCCFQPTSSTFVNALEGNDGEYRLRRRAANGCGTSAYADTLTVNTVPRDGVISGKVSSPAGIGGPGAGVPGVTITAVRTTQVEGGQFTTDTYTVETNSQGNYALSDLYYGPGANGAGFTVTASRSDTVIRIDSIIVSPPDTIYETIVINHVFDPISYSGSDSVLLKSTLKTAINVDFTDLTSFTFSGNVFQDYNGTPCGLFNTEIYLNGVVKDSADVFGNYSISIPSIGDYTIEAKFKNHTFDTLYSDIYIDRDFYDQNFESENIQRVYGAFTDGCGTPITGEATLTFSDTINCIEHIVETIGGQYDFPLPAKNYKVSFNHPNQEIDLFFAASRSIDISCADTLLNYRYHAPPVIEITGLPEASSCAAPYDVPIVEQAVTYPVSINIYEGVIGGCPVDTGFLQIIDEISDKGSDTVNVYFSNGSAMYNMFPDKPNLTPDHLKEISIAAKDIYDQISESFQLSAFVSGVRSREQQFTTVTPEIPFLILRDPPGDASYSFVEQSETIETATRFFAAQAENTNIWTEVKLGTQFEAGFIGFDVETEIWGQIGSTLEIGATSSSSAEAIMSITTSETFSTSGNPDVTGVEGDVFVGAAMNMLYATADILTFNETTCSPKLDVNLIMKNDGFSTKFIYTEAYIRNNVIPDLLFLSQFPTRPDSVTFYLNQVKAWEQTLARNEELKLRSDFIENISFSNSTPYDNTTTIENSESLTIEFLSEINQEIAAEAGVEVAGIGASGGVTVMLKVEMGVSETNTTTKTLTTGFHLEDDDSDGIGDGFTVDVLTDPVYKTPVFKTIAGESSCPWEEGTLPRDEPELTVANPIATDVPLGNTAFFNFELKNTSQSMEARTYVLRLKQESNPYGAIVTIGGVPAPPAGIGYTIDYLGTQMVTVGVSFGQPGFYSYEALEFELMSACDEDISETAIISIFWQSPCSDIGLFDPEPAAATPETGWRITSNTLNRELNVHIKDYDEKELDQVIVEYAKVGGTNWTNLAVITAANLEPNDPDGTNLGTIVPVNFGAIPDGAYNIRLQLICSGNRIFSRRAIGLIDTRSPELLGIPEPRDDSYDTGEGDIIAVNFDEMIDCSSATAVLTRLDNNNEVLPIMPLACTARGIEVIPAGSLPVPGAYRVSISGVKDQFGNERQDVNWLFITPGYIVEDTCDPLLLSNNNVNQDAINVAVYQRNSIMSDGMVQGFGITKFVVEESMVMNEGFEIQPGGLFIGQIENCVVD